MLLIATIMSAIILAVSPLTSLVSTQAFAQSEQSDKIVESVLDKLSQDDTSNQEEDSNNQDDNSVNEGSEEGGVAAVDPTAQINLDSNNQDDNSVNEGDDNSITVDPKTQTSVQPGINVNVDTHVIMDEENCEDANDEVTQANVQDANQEALSDGEVGEGSIYVSPKLQTSTQIALNVNVDTDVILADCGVPSDELTQANVQRPTQRAGGTIEADDEHWIIVPANQRADVIGLNIGEDTDVIRPLPLP
jgi:hypothetical protein